MARPQSRCARMHARTHAGGCSCLQQPVPNANPVRLPLPCVPQMVCLTADAKAGPASLDAEGGLGPSGSTRTSQPRLRYRPLCDGTPVPCTCPFHFLPTLHSVTPGIRMLATASMAMRLWPASSRSAHACSTSHRSLALPMHAHFQYHHTGTCSNVQHTFLACSSALLHLLAFPHSNIIKMHTAVWYKTMQQCVEVQGSGL